MRVAASILFLLTATAALALDQRAALLLDDLPSADGILAEYQIFDNADDSARLNHAALGNGASAHSRRLWFDSADDYARTASNEAVNATTELTVMAWIYPTNYAGKTAGGNGQAVASRYDTAGGGRSWELAISIVASPLIAGSLVVQFGDSVGGYSGRVGIRPGVTYPPHFPGVAKNDTWHHVGFTFDNGVVRLYHNGVEYEPTSYGTIPGTLYTSSLPLTIGNVHNNEHGFHGGIGPVKMYNRVATDEIARDYLGGPPQ